MVNKLFRGTGVAIVTPFRDDNSIDFASMRNVIEHLISGGVEYIVALGTTGESVTLNGDEKIAVISFVLETVNNRIPVVMGVGGNNTHEVVNSLEKVSDSKLDVSAILSVSPYYNKPTQKGLYEHYRKVADSIDLPVILYNVPGRTAMNITASTTLELARDAKNIVAVKEASGDLNQINHILKDKPAGFEVISGDDQLTLPMISLGAIGAISVSANAFPAEFSAMVRYALDDQMDKARKIQNALLDLMDAHFIEGNPSGVKASLSVKGIIENNLRLPLCSVSTETYKKIESLINKLDQVKNTLSV